MAEEEEGTTRNWVDLPTDITQNILHRLGAIEILENAQKVCTNWYKICKDPAMWRIIDIRLNGGRFRSNGVKMCKHAVDRSQGQLVDISIEFFGSDKLLRRIADRSSQLRRLQLIKGDANFGLKTAVSRLPLLEELHLYNTVITEKTIQTIGHSCTRLRSFTLDFKGYSRRDYEEAVLAIAETMPGLRHLTLFGKVSDDGVQAILDKLPHLECLDLSRCKFGLKKDILKRCSSQIKDFRCPPDSSMITCFTANGVVVETLYFINGGTGVYRVVTKRLGIS